jgi:hypothetical protein
MLVSEMRRKVKSVYGNSTWDARVDRMADNQVIAIFYSMEEKGKFKNKKADSYDQINLFDCFGIDGKMGC